MLPNFLIVGAPKAGTTSLYHYLSEHPEVFMSEPKEVNFFSAEEIEKQGLYYKDFKASSLEEYKKLFKKVKDEKAIGEGSVSYLFYPQTPIKIKREIPDVKIIILLRNPVERAYSHYLMDFRMGLVTLSFEDIIYKNANHKNLHLYYQQYIELGFYYDQVKRYLNIFGREKVKVYLQEDLRKIPDTVICDLYDFLGINKTFRPDTNQVHNSFSMPKNKLIHKLYAFNSLRILLKDIFPSFVKEKIKTVFFERKNKPKLKEESKKYLQELYHKDIEKLETLIEKNLSSWYKG